MTSSMPLGAALGSLMAGYLAKNFGRRPIFIVSDIIGILNGFLFLIARLEVGIIARFIMGILGGISCAIIPVYVREISPISLQGFTVK